MYMYMYIYTKLRRNEGHHRVSQGMWKREGEPLSNSSKAPWTVSAKHVELYILGGSIFASAMRKRQQGDDVHALAGTAFLL